VADLSGDLAGGVRTLAVRMGLVPAGRLAFAMMCASAGVAFLPAVFRWCGVVYLVFAIAHSVAVAGTLQLPLSSRYRGVLVAIACIIVGSFLDLAF